jgi:16S rRNA (uracil1498-N3)-methyltransferase
MQLFYKPDLDSSYMQLYLSEEESKHVVRVLRKSAGDRLSITNGKGSRFSAEILDAHPKKCLLEIRETTKQPAPHYELHMAVAPTKSNERFEWFLEKATEIGVHRITPLLCERSERKTIKLERYEKIIVSAMKQSLRDYKPQLDPFTPLKEFLDQKQSGSCYIAHCEEEEKLEFKRVVQPDHPLCLMIGPEGDFSPDEIQWAKARGFSPVSLGMARLRTETAALVGCTIVAMRKN